MIARHKVLTCLYPWTPMNTFGNSLRLGTFYCVLSAAAYTAYNVCLRYVSKGCDPVWVNCVQTTVSVAVFGGYLLWRTVHGQRTLPPGRELGALLTMGLVTQIGGVLFVWAMSAVGVAITGTLQLGVTLAASALLGLIVLGERISWQQAVAIALITVSVVFFSLGVESDGEATATQGPSVHVLLGIAAAVLSGVAFAVLTVGVRKVVTSQTSPEAVVLFINLMGVTALGPWSVYRLGVAELLKTAPGDVGVMLMAGAMNLIAFFLVTKSLQMIPVVRFNVLQNGLVTVLTAAMGIVLFTEPWNKMLLCGILLSIAGILVISFATSTA